MHSEQMTEADPIETMFVEIPLAIVLGAAAGLATRILVGLSVRRLLSYAAFVGVRDDAAGDLRGDGRFCNVLASSRNFARF